MMNLIRFTWSNNLYYSTISHLCLSCTDEVRLFFILCDHFCQSAATLQIVDKSISTTLSISWYCCPAFGLDPGYDLFARFYYPGCGLVDSGVPISTTLSICHSCCLD